VCENGFVGRARGSQFKGRIVKFEDYKSEGHTWITLATGEFYPDVLDDAKQLYKPVLITFKDLVSKSSSSEELLKEIAAISETWMRIQLCRVFRKYVSPATPVEMLKQKSKAQQICDQFGHLFRKITEVHQAAMSRPDDDEAICAILWEYKDRGQSGYDLTERAFGILRSHLEGFTVEGPERAGRDVIMGTVFPDYPKPDRPVDFLIRNEEGMVVAVGLARYDSDRGGAQEDDRTGQYREVATEIVDYFNKTSEVPVKVLFVNDGPGLLLGSMWNDYAYLENMIPGRLMVATLRMLTERVTPEWLAS
jgi:hypothetical protein